jgi:hypothetical protein
MPRAYHETQKQLINSSKATTYAMPGMDIEYNHDLKVSEEFLAGYPTIRDLLKDDRLIGAFEYFDLRAKSHKRMVEVLGVWSLVTGLVPLMAAAVRVMIGEGAFSKLTLLRLTAECSGLVSVLIILWGRLRRHRVQWCRATFCRERLRQWHFQTFLDGGLVDLFARHREAFITELDRRWGALLQDLRDGYGMMTEFVRLSSHDVDFLHPTTQYSEKALAEDVVAALWTLRLEHQLRFSRRKIEPESESAGLALEERTALAESLGSSTLVGAIMIGALTFVVSIDHLLLGSFGLPWNSDSIGRILTGAALLLTVLSAASRAYCAGYTLPEEPESYHEYCERVMELRSAFISVSSVGEKLNQLARLEEEAASELRRVLRMKMRATFVF